MKARKWNAKDLETCHWSINEGGCNTIFSNYVRQNNGSPVTTNTGSSPRTGVLMYVFVFARRALILHPDKKMKKKC